MRVLVQVLVTTTLILAWPLLGSAGGVERPAGLTMPWNETFDRPALDAGWTVDASAGNTLAVVEGALEIRAGMNTYAHVQRPLDIDFIRVTCGIKPSPAITWCTSLFIYWDAGNYCQIGLIDRDGGTLYVLEMIDQQAHEYSIGPCAFGPWRYVGIELGADCIRYLASETGDGFKVERGHRRPEQFATAPKLLVVGKGHSGPAGYPAPDLNNDYAEPGPPVVSHVRDIRVEPVPWARLRATAEEQAVWQAKDLDLLGERELAATDDPTFASVSRHFPAMKHPREIVGVKDHPHAIGVASDGSLQLNDGSTNPEFPVGFFEIGDSPYRFGSGTQPCRKKLLNGYMPIVVAEDEHDGVTMTQTILGYTKGFSPDEPLVAYVRLNLVNGSDAARHLPVRLRVTPTSEQRPPRDWTIEVPARGERALTCRVPYAIMETPAEEVPAAEFDAKLTETVRYWEELIAPGTRFEVPEQRVQDGYRAWLAYNFLNVAKRDGIYHVCDGSGFYTQIYGYSAALYSLMLDLMGWHEQSRIYLDSLLTFQEPDGLFCVNFGHSDTGTLLHVLAHHYRITRDADWLRGMAPKMIAMCDWIIRHRRDSMFHVHAKRSVVHGLIRYRPYCDHELPAFDYFSNAYLCVGMEQAAAVLAEVGLADEAQRLTQEAGAFRQDILTSMDAAVITRDGMKMLPIMPDTHTLLKEAQYTANGYYGLLASCLLETEFLGPRDHRTDWLVDMLRRKGGLVLGTAQFFEMIDHAYTYGYWLTCLNRDEPKRVILGLYASMAYGMTHDTYSAVECTYIRTGENYWTLPHTYSNTKQVRLLRNMLVREAGDELRIGDAIPRPWLAHGQRVAIKNAPTAFGPVSAVIESRVRDGVIAVRIEPPTRQTPAVVQVRLRHPEQLAIKSLEPEPRVPLTFEGDTIRLPRLAKPVTLTVKYRGAE